MMTDFLPVKVSRRSSVNNEYEVFDSEAPSTHNKSVIGSHVPPQCMNFCLCSSSSWLVSLTYWVERTIASECRKPNLSPIYSVL